MKTIFFAGLLCIVVQYSFAQTKYFSKDAKISFYSKAPLEDIEAHNYKGVSVFDLSTGQIECSALLKGFEFPKAKMQEHFNEEYVESDKFPKAVFTGNISNIKDVKVDKDGTYNVEVSGSLTLHGITKPQHAQAVITVKNGAVSAVSDFTLTVADYGIKIPSLVAEKIGKTVKIVMNVSSFQLMGAKS